MKILIHVCIRIDKMQLEPNQFTQTTQNINTFDHLNTNKCSFTKTFISLFPDFKKWIVYAHEM